jgi:predicted ATP-grasp superfamily ATP-dependent carboligase
VRKAVVLGHGDTALGVVRALAQSGVKVIYVSTATRDHARFSKFISDRVRAPFLKDNGRELLGFLLETRKNWDGALLVPCNDVSVSFVSRNRDALKARYVSAVQGWDVISRIMNKRLLYPHAQEIGVPLPTVLFPDSIQSLARDDSALGYPCILKPHESHSFFDVYQRKVQIVHNPEELIQKFSDAQRHNVGVMVSEIIPGPDHCLFNYHSYVDNEGSVLAEMCLQKLRQHPVGFGVSCLSKTVPMIRGSV